MKQWVAMVVLMAWPAGAWAAAPPDAETLARFGKIQEATQLNRHGMALYHGGRWPEATKVFAEVLRMREGLYPKARYPQGHPDLASSINNLAFLYQTREEYAKAEPLFRRVLKMREGLYPQARYPHGHPDLARSINNLAALHKNQGEYAKAEPLYRRALQMCEGLYPQARYPQGHPDLATSINNLAFLHLAQREYAKAVPLFRRALRMRERLYPKARFPHGHPQLAASITNLGGLHYSQGEYAQAEPLFRSALEMYEGLYPKARFLQGHPDLARSINNLALLHKDQGEYAKAEPLFCRALEMNEGLYPKARFPHGHPHLALSINNLAFLHVAQGEYAKAEPLYYRALQMCEGLYPKMRFPQGHPDLARSINNLAALHKDQGEHAKAEPLYYRALQMCEGLYPKTRFPQGHPDLAKTINNLAILHYAQGEYAKAESLYRRALEMREGLFPKERFLQGHPDLAESVNNLAALHNAQGEYAKAEPLYRRALEMREQMFPKGHYPQGHPDLATSINNLAFLYQAQGEYAKAEPLFRRALQMREGLYPKMRFPKGHPDLVTSINNLAFLYQAQGEFAKAEPLYHRALQMSVGLFPKKRYPLGHPDLALGINNLAFLHHAQRQYAKAELLYRRVLKMREGLYPQARYPHGHPDLARSINNLAALHKNQGEYAKAEPLYRRALQMCEGLFPMARYPQGHPELAHSINNLGALHYAQGEYAKAVPLCRRALEMREGLYPKGRYPQGHPELAESISNLAFLHQTQGEYAKAEPLYRRALQMNAASATALATHAPEATALNFLVSLPMTRDAYLSVTRRLPEVDAYLAVWQSKAALSRIYERRHLAVLATSSPQARALWNAILALRRERETLLLAPADPVKAAARDKRLEAIDEEFRIQEVELLPLLPALKRSDKLVRATPADLRKALPTGSAFVDLVRYVHFEQDPAKPGQNGETRTPRYVAFVVTRQSIQRVELGKAQPIEEMLDLWRRAIQEGSPAEANYAAKVHALLWTSLRKHLPAKTSLLHVSPDAALNRLPWAALRDGKSGRILIEEHAVAVVPHGVLLLDRLTEEKRGKSARPTLLAMGGVAYDRRPARETEVAMGNPAGDAVKWGSLDGTAKELTQIVTLARDRRVIRREGEKAAVATLLADLPAAETVHLATHGFFAAPRFRTALQFDAKLFRSTEFDSGLARRSGAGARSPMVLSGLVCSGANLPGTANRGVLTAEAVAGLDLRRLKLAVLSACETGLGETAGGEGVYGLARAFHIAGTRNVVASLWKVNDAATTALMVLFYRHLWEDNLPPMEALRRAQLSLYYHPEAVKGWAEGERGPDLKKTVQSSAVAPPAAVKGRARSQWWAAFVLSGPGN